MATGACPAYVGHNVTLVDVNEEWVAELEAGKLPIYEPGLEEHMAKNASRLRFTTELAPLAREADVVFSAVDTPQGEDGSVDLTAYCRGSEPMRT